MHFICRGVGQQGQLGHKNLESVYEPQQITSLMNEKYNVSAVACGIAHTFFLTDNGRLLACGQNIYGALGMNTMAEAVLIPTCVELNFEAHIVHISCGGAHTAVVDALGRLYTAGSNTCGQLGLGNFNDSCAHFSQVTSFVLDVPIEANRAYDTVKIYDENKKLPLCAYVCCGEEFTVVITQDHFVFTVGLGLGTHSLLSLQRLSLQHSIVTFYRWPIRSCVESRQIEHFSPSVNIGR